MYQTKCKSLALTSMSVLLKAATATRLQLFLDAQTLPAPGRVVDAQLAMLAVLIDRMVLLGALCLKSATLKQRER
jgi:hypothetical protein